MADNHRVHRDNNLVHKVVVALPADPLTRYCLHTAVVLCFPKTAAGVVHIPDGAVANPDCSTVVVVAGPNRGERAFVADVVANPVVAAANIVALPVGVAHIPDGVVPNLDYCVVLVVVLYQGGQAFVAGVAARPAVVARPTAFVVAAIAAVLPAGVVHIPGDAFPIRLAKVALAVAVAARPAVVRPTASASLHVVAVAAFASLHAVFASPLAVAATVFVLPAWLSDPMPVHLPVARNDKAP